MLRWDFVYFFRRDVWRVFVEEGVSCFGFRVGYKVESWRVEVLDVEWRLRLGVGCVV